MKYIGRFLILAMLLPAATFAIAQAPTAHATAAQAATNDFATCLVDNLSGKERKNLAKWVFMAMAAHPEIKKYANVSAADIKESNQYVGTLITRLLTVDCPTQLKTAQASDPMAARKGFEMVGKVAMQELMTNQDVVASITGYIPYVDQKKINKVLMGN